MAQLLDQVSLSGKVVGRTLPDRNGMVFYDIELPSLQVIKRIPATIVQESVCEQNPNSPKQSPSSKTSNTNPH